ncbi:MAG: sodium:proton antiporter [Calditrichaeota bacterium]|nr:sodium:proton antiporter [Calditrichota bacterium]
MWYWIPGLLLVLTAAAFGAELISNYINLPAPLSGGGGDDLGKALPVWSIIPFVGILLSIAVFPLVAGHWWHHNFGKVSLFWALLFGIPFVIAFKGAAIHEILHVYLLEYIPFIILLWALFTISGGILVQGSLVGRPLSNLVVLILGTALASWIGTTGAAMVLIRPLIRMNAYRKSKVHLIVFFIFLVANIGGSLTPLGDPPLFLGFLQGVQFFWTLHLLPAMLTVSVILFVIFFAWDTFMFRKEGWGEGDNLEKAVAEAQAKSGNAGGKLAIKGAFNVLFLLGVIAGVLFSGSFHLGEITLLGIHMKIESLVRDGFLILMGLLSLQFTPKLFREGNDFNWFPILEVAKLFAGIFITIIPALAMLRSGMEGHLSFVIEAVKNPASYFWITGMLSSFLDNAPTYLVFFNTALGKTGQDVHWLMTEGKITLEAISCGAVFFGAMTYIGNAPNFMVKSIAEQSDIVMPSFFGYMLYSFVILGLLFGAVTLIFFA